MIKNNQGNFFLLLRKIGFALSSATHTSVPKTILRRLFRYARTKVMVTNFDGDLSMELHLSDHMQRRIFWMGYYNANIADLFNTILKPGMTILDVGANSGEVTLLAAKRVGLQGRVFAFEPIDSIARQLAHHVQINNLTQVNIEPYALGNINNETIPIYASCGQEVKDANNGLGSIYGNEGETPLQQIQMTTLDTWLQARPGIQRIDLIKIDIEGAELPCLHGARECLRLFKPHLIVEIQDFTSARAGYKSSDILDFLSGFGYVFHKIGPNGSLAPLTSANLSSFQNVLCTPQDSGARHP